MAEYGFNELISEIANNKRSFAEYAFKKQHFSDENTKDVYLDVCEKIASCYAPYGFQFAKSGPHITLKQKDTEFVYKITFQSSHYNIPGKNVVIDVFANILSQRYKKWKIENKSDLKFNSSNWPLELNEYITGGNIGNLQKEHKYLSWNVGTPDTREKKIEDIIENINNLAIPFFSCFENRDRLIHEIESGNLNYYFGIPSNAEKIINFYLYLSEIDINQRDIVRRKLHL